jgi:Rieske Fe-S protein
MSRERHDKPEVSALLDRIREDAPVSRRDYLRILVTVSGGLAAGTAAVALGAFSKHGLGSAPPLKIADRISIGAAVRFNYPSENDPAMAMRLQSGRLVAYSSVCTHLGCSVLWQDQRLQCPCHNGEFDPSTGEVVAGPPPRALPRVLLEERSDGIYAVGTETVE